MWWNVYWTNWPHGGGQNQRTSKSQAPLSQKSAVVQHSIDKGHKIMFDQTKILYGSNHYWDQIINEVIEIKQEKKNFNRDGRSQLSQAWTHTLNRLKSNGHLSLVRQRYRSFDSIAVNTGKPWTETGDQLLPVRHGLSPTNNLTAVICLPLIGLNYPSDFYILVKTWLSCHNHQYPWRWLQR